MTVAISDALISVRGVTKRFGRTAALRGIDLDVRQGEKLALFGPNGSGKTTLLRVLAGLLPPSRGAVEIAGMVYRRRGREIRHRIGVLGHHPYLYDDLTGEENLLFYGRMYGVDRVAERAQSALALAGIERRARDKVRTYSRGMQQRLALARATLHDPDVLLLDEPDTGLDQEAFAGISSFLERDSGKSRTVVMATHDLRLGHTHCDRFAIMSEGHVVHEGDTSLHDIEALERLYWEQTSTRGDAK